MKRGRKGRKEEKLISIIFSYGLPSTVFSGPYSTLSKSSLQSSDCPSVPVTGLQCQCCPLRLEYLIYHPCLTHTLVLVGKWQKPHFHQGCWRNIPIAHSLSRVPLDASWAPLSLLEHHAHSATLQLVGDCCVFLVSLKRTETMTDLFIIVFPAFGMLPDTKCVFNRFVKLN